MLILKSGKYIITERKIKIYLFVYAITILISIFALSYQYDQVHQYKQQLTKINTQVEELKLHNLSLYTKLNKVNDIISSYNSPESQINNLAVIDLLMYFKKSYDVKIGNFYFERDNDERYIKHSPYNVYELSFSLEADNDSNIINFLTALETNLPGVKFFARMDLENSRIKKKILAESKLVWFVPKNNDKLNVKTLIKHIKNLSSLTSGTQKTYSLPAWEKSLMVAND